ncbi:tripartite motif-containing protein 2-like [Saccostrea cucullata]|uniref:tripartite motif-containing protein 2-like n=1 Tax=Saccostrea cuccullata TaxID=36930 RepID=UPI002ECFD22F
MIDTYDMSKLFYVTSNAHIYRKLPEKLLPSLPKFFPGKILGENFGALTSSSLVSDEHGYSMKTTQISPEAGSSPPVKQLLDKPQTIINIRTGYVHPFSVACLNDENIWGSGTGNLIKLFSTHNPDYPQLKSICTRSRNTPSDITVTKSGDLVYSDFINNTVNIVKNEKIEEVIRLENWSPQGICSTCCGDLLVTMFSNDGKQTKVVRYSGSTKKQTFQFDDKGKPLYSSGRCDRFITENRNLDVCVSDSDAEAVVVVNQAGKLRFRYTGHARPTSLICEPISLQGITTDSQSHILTADYNNHCVHIIDQDGQFLRYIDCVSYPWGLCTDTNDNLFVVQWGRRDVKKIKYLQ